MAGVNWSVQLIGLLSAWKQERRAISDDKYQDFMKWLQNHNFQELSNKIHESKEVSQGLHSLLSESIDKIDHKLDAIANSVAELASKIDGLNTLDRATSESSGTLSTQAREILKLFADRTEDTHLCLKPWGDQGTPVLVFTPTGVSFSMEEVRLMESDVKDLETANLIAVARYDSAGTPYFALTRSGFELAKSLPSVEILQEGERPPLFSW